MTWFKDSEPLPASNRYETNHNLTNDMGSLKISNLQKNDIGSYLVVAENKVGKDQTFCKLSSNNSPDIDQTPYVNPEAFRYLEADPKNYSPKPDKDDVKHRPPVVIVPLSDININEGDSVKFVCKIDGYPKPKVRNSKIIFFS